MPPSNALPVIRPYCTSDCDAVLDIWLQASVQAHGFVPASFWQAQLQDMRQHYLPQAETFVLEVQGKVLGFLCLHENQLAALFIAPGSQGQGLGHQLMAHAKRQRRVLTLSVYCANTRAAAFYQACGFTTIGEQIDPHTGQPERSMCWSAC